MDLLLFWMFLPWSTLAILIAGRKPLPLSAKSASGDEPTFMAGLLPMDTEDQPRMPWRLVWLRVLPATMALPALFWCSVDTQDVPWVLLGLAPLIPLHILCLRQSRSIQEEERRATREMSWIIWRRGSIQNDIMRAREHEATDRRGAAASSVVTAEVAYADDAGGR